MDKILNMICWPITLTLIPLDAGVIVHYIYEEYFGADFWMVVVVYILLCVSTGVRLYLIEQKGRN